jgi:RecA/RadA recombinase
MAKKKKVESAAGGSSMQMKGLLKQHEKDHYNFKEDVYYQVSTGSLILDIHTGGGIMPGLHRFCGVNEGGKTSEALEVMRNALKSVENCKGVYVKSEGRLSPEMEVRAGIKFCKDPDDWGLGSCFILESNVYETVFKIIKTLVTDNEENIRYCFVIDSMDSLIPKCDVDKDLDEASKVAGGALLASKIMQRISLDMNKGGHIMILISQVRADIQIDPYSKRPFKTTSASGGHALLHYANFIFEFEGRYKKDLFLEKPNMQYDPKKNKIIGHEVKVTIKKSPNEKTNAIITYPVKYGRKGGTSIWKELEVKTLLFENGQLNKSGAWAEADSSVIEEAKSLGIECPAKFHGEQAILTFLEENPKFVEHWYNRFKDALS